MLAAGAVLVFLLAGTGAAPASARSGLVHDCPVVDDPVLCALDYATGDNPTEEGRTYAQVLSDLITSNEPAGQFGPVGTGVGSETSLELMAGAGMDATTEEEVLGGLELMFEESGGAALKDALAVSPIDLLPALTVGTAYVVWKQVYSGGEPSRYVKLRLAQLGGLDLEVPSGLTGTYAPQKYQWIPCTDTTCTSAFADMRLGLQSTVGESDCGAGLPCTVSSWGSFGKVDTSNPASPATWVPDCGSGTHCATNSRNFEGLSLSWASALVDDEVAVIESEYATIDGDLPSVATPYLGAWVQWQPDTPTSLGGAPWTGNQAERLVWDSADAAAAATGTISATDPGGETQLITSTEPGLDGAHLNLNANGVHFTLQEPCVQSVLDAYLNPDFYPVVSCDAFGTPTGVFELPLPETTNQTCEEYVTFLATFGYTGDASCVSLPESSLDPTVGPQAPAKVKWTSPDGGVKTIGVTPGTWPFGSGPGPEITTDSPLTIYKNPDDAPPVGEGTGPGGVGGGLSCGGPTIPAVNFSPLIGLDYGSKFPFGVVSWMVDGISGWEGEASAPTITLPIFWTNFGSSAPGDSNYEIDLARFDPFMATFRALVLLEALVGAVWGYGTAALGWGRGGEQLTIPGM